MYSRGIFGSCVAKMFFVCVSQIMCRLLPSLRMTRNCSTPLSSSCLAASSFFAYTLSLSAPPEAALPVSVLAATPLVEAADSSRET
jgi:hypothetical protein